MSSFEPVAIVGRSCVLPGALSPEALFDAVRDARVLIREAPEGAWGLDSKRLIAEKSPGAGVEYVVSNRGGYVTGFDDIFDAAFFADKVKEVERLDPLTRWLLHCARVALGEAGVDTAPARTGLVVGNLSYPTVEHTRFVEDHWLRYGKNAPKHGVEGAKSDPRNRFSSGGPAHIVAKAFGLTGDVFALDAACASSLYALEIACRRLQGHESDLMLAGGVARADPLFIHLGFTALQALSPSGRSRPLHQGADGLLPAEGAGLVALKRLSDAIRDDDRIFGVIRGIGLSNDGRQSGFLAPATDGQVRAMEAAYSQAGLTPSDIDFIECHATGTPRGDTVELDSLAQVWGEGPKPTIGSLKANIGHPITASGVASLLKVLSSFEAKLYPPTPCDRPLAAIADYGFRLLQKAEPWDKDGPRRAAISNFGFGGNNAHLIVEEWTGEVPAFEAPSPSPAVKHAEPIAISAIGVIAGESVGLPTFVRRLVAARGTESTRTEEIVLRMTGLGFPPNDLQESLAQQTSILAVVEEALGQVGGLNPDRTGVYIGMCVDPQAARHGLRVRLRERVSPDVDMDEWRDVNSESARHLTAAGVIGCMPNIPANRVHAQQDWRAPGFTVASEELSGVDALKLAVRALQEGGIDAALVGASDFSHEAAHRAAAEAVLPDDRSRPGDAAVALVLMRERDALEKGYPVFATLVEAMDTTPAGAVELALSPDAGESEVTARFGHAHGASGLLHVAAGAVTAHLGIDIDRAGAWPAPRRQDSVHTRTSVTAVSGLQSSVDLVAPASPCAAISPVDAPLMRVYAAPSMSELAQAVADDRTNSVGALRLALVAGTESHFAALRNHAATELAAGRVPSAPGLYFGTGDPEGEVAFCYTGAAAAYPGAARDLMLAFPRIGHGLTARFAGTPRLAADMYGADVQAFTPAMQLTGSSFVCQVHTEFTREILGMRPQVAMGLSSGETNSLLAFGVWHDLDDMVADIESSEMYVNQLTGDCRSAAEYWGLPEGEVPRWKNYRLSVPIEAVEKAVEDEPLVYITVIHHYADVVIGGDSDACDRVLEKVGRNRAMDLGLDMVVHCAPLTPFESAWHHIHVRDTSEVPDVRFYTNAGNRAYVPTREAAADAITQQAIDPVDFPKTVEQAYADGVRVFVEHGPRATLTGAIGRILEGRPHTVVALDPLEGAGLELIARQVARLWVIGVPMELAEFTGRLDDLRAGRESLPEPEGALLRLAAHAPEVVWPDSFSPTHSTVGESALLRDSEQTAHTANRPALVTGMKSSSDSPSGNMMAPPPGGGFGYDVGRLFESGQPALVGSATIAVAASQTRSPAGADAGAAVVRAQAAPRGLDHEAAATGTSGSANGVPEAGLSRTHDSIVEATSDRGADVGSEVTPADGPGTGTPPTGGDPMNTGASSSSDGAPRSPAPTGPPPTETAPGPLGTPPLESHNPALEVFNTIAATHADYLRQQKEAHDAFLALGLQVAAASAQQPPLAVPPAQPVLARPDPDLQTTPAPAANLAPPPASMAPPTSAGAPAAPPATKVAPLSTSGSAAPAAGNGAALTPAGPAPSHTAQPGTPDLRIVVDAPASTTPPPASRAKGAAGPTPEAPIGPPIDRASMPETVFLTREQLEVHAGGKISEIFGDLFEQQDGYARQVRMPEPPLLFADRALMIEGEPGTMKKGRVVTETDVHEDAWYLHAGRMAPGVVIESGQADLLLISWLGADFLNKGDRVYRLLGCDLTFHGDLPAPGETLTYDIYVDGHAKTGDVRLFFFHYDCYVGDRPLISVRNGQAGFFTNEELAGSGGVLWDAADDEPDPDARLDPAPRLSTKRSFSAEDLQRWVEGDAFACFGEGFELASCHTRTPNTPGGRLKLIDQVPVFEPEGGPWGRGYLRAEAHVPADAWFYQGHFKNDSCMPGTLMADAATQALSFTMAAMGFTLPHDGWRFEPVPGQVARFLCRGQVIPDGPHDLEYEVFIEEVVDGDLPEVYASLLCKSDGFKVFQCRRFGLRLVPDYPLTTKREFLEGAEPIRYVGPGDSDVRGDYEALLSCAWGRPSDAFGKMFTKFDGALKCPRLPGPPYHFVSSIVEVDVAPGSASEGGTLVSTFDIDPDAWYFAEGQGHMPFAILVEALLQPCGWFASYLNFFADTEGDVAFRNLDGENCILHKPVPPDIGVLKLTTKLTRFAKAGGTSIVFFDVVCEDDSGPVMTLTTDFGFFSPKILEDQKGMTMTDEMRARRDAVSPVPAFSLLDGGGPLAHLPSMASGKMRMLDEVTGFWADGGDAGLGRIRTFQKIHADAWYFKAHFHEDPVQPGSLGLEALVQSARALMHMKGWLDGLENPVWEHPIVGFPLAWKYRGQVVPSREEVITEVEALKVEIVDGESVTLEIYGTQWVDGLRIYEVPAFALRVRAGGK